MPTLYTMEIIAFVLMVIVGTVLVFVSMFQGDIGINIAGLAMTFAGCMLINDRVQARRKR